MKLPLKHMAFLGLLACAGICWPTQGYGADIPAYDIKSPVKKELVYSIYAGGFAAVDGSFKMDLAPKAYDIGLTLKTRGFIGELFPWSGDYSTAGHAASGNPPMPTKTMAKSIWRKNLKTTEIEYGPDGKVLKATFLEKDKTATVRDFAPDLADGTIDMLSAMMMIVQSVEKNGACKGNLPVFDGKRRFNIILQDGGKDTIAPSKYSIFSGEAVKCTVKVEPVAGFKKKDMKRGWMAVQNHTEERQKPPTLWMARTTPDGPLLLVRMEIASVYGSVVAHLAAEK